MTHRMRLISKVCVLKGLCYKTDTVSVSPPLCGSVERKGDADRLVFTDYKILKVYVVY